MYDIVQWCSQNLGQTCIGVEDSCLRVTDLANEWSDLQFQKCIFCATALRHTAGIYFRLSILPVSLAELVFSKLQQPRFYATLTSGIISIWTCRARHGSSIGRLCSSESVVKPRNKEGQTPNCARGEIGLWHLTGGSVSSENAGNKQFILPA